MRFKVTLLLAMILSVTVVSGVYAAAPISLTKESFFEGFNGIPWGADIRSLKDMVLVVEGVEWGNHYASYRRKGDPLRFGKLKVRSITYSFTNGKFSGCSIPLPSRKADPDASEYMKVYNEVKRIFGNVVDDPPGGTIISWFFPKLEIILELWGTANPYRTFNALDKERDISFYLNSPIYGTPQSPHFYKNFFENRE